MDLCIWLAEVLDDLLLPLLIILVADADEVVSLGLELPCKMNTMIHARCEHDGLHGLAEYLQRLADPLGHNVAGDLHAASAGFLLRPLACNFLRASHVDFFCNEHAQGYENFLLDKFFGGDGADYIVIDFAQPLREWCRSQPDHANVGIVLNELYCLLARLVRFIHDQKVQSWKRAALLQRLR